MWFHFCTANHDSVGRSTLVDMAAWFEAGLLDLGHKVTFSESHVEPSAINLFWECFLPGMGSQIGELGVRYGIIATEIPDGVGFNWRTEPHWKARFDAFAEMASGADFIWAMVESTVPFYSRYCPTAFMELGFSERLIPSYINEEQVFDFSFFGLKTPYRIEVVERLRKYANVVWPDKFLTADEVGGLIGKTKVGLNFKQSELWPIPSPTRLGRLMMAKRDIASEYTEVMTRQGEIVGLCPPGQNLVDFALERLGSDWKGRADRVFEEYRVQMKMRDIMDSVLHRTVSDIVVNANSGNAVSVKSILPPVLVGSVNGYNIVHYQNLYHGLPQRLGPIDLANADLSKLPLVLIDEDRSKLEERILAQKL